MGSHPRIENEMHVIRHQAIAVHPATQLLLPLDERVEVEDAIRVVRKDNAAIVSFLDHVMRVVRQDDASGPGHTRVTRIEPAGGT